MYFSCILKHVFISPPVSDSLRSGLMF